MVSVSLVRNLLRPPDQVRTILEVNQITNESPETTSHRSKETYSDRRVLAVISHKENWNPTEEGCLFVFKSRRLNSVVAPVAGNVEQQEELDVHSAFPIFGEFHLTMSQMRRQTVDSSVSLKLGRVSAMNASCSVITLSIHPAEGLLGHGSNLTFGTTDVDGLKRLVAECKRLKDVTDTPPKSITNFSWLRYYFAKRTTVAALTSIPQDLRQLTQKIHERLSQAWAGHVDNEHSDVQILRDDWIRRTARNKSIRGSRRLFLRLGTFNVDGKMPTQDLSDWVQASCNRKLGEKGKTEFISESNNASSFSSSVPRSLSEDITQTKKKASTRVDEVDPDDPDLFVFGFQELDHSTEALFYSTNTTREDAWCHAIFAALGEKGVKYEKIASKQLVGMLILIIAKKSLKQSFGDVSTTAAGAGILGVMGNKGGTAIRLSFTPLESPQPDDRKSASDFAPLPNSTIFTFVNTHLAAFDEMAEKRNSDFHELSKRLSFENPVATSTPPVQDFDKDNHWEDIFESGPPLSMSEFYDDETSQVNAPLSIYDTDVLFWLVSRFLVLSMSSYFSTGRSVESIEPPWDELIIPFKDLNYRVDIPDYEMRRILQDQEWVDDSKFEALLHFDQLKKAIKSRTAFFGFHEGDITHMPTYRFSPGIATDSLGYDEKRKPAWTDRILYMHGPASQVIQISSTSYPRISFSDHRPVASDFYVDCDFYDTEEYRSDVRTQFNKVNCLDVETGHDKGGIRIDDMFIDFGKISLGTNVERKIVIRNTGKSPCAFRFVPTEPESPIHPEWLQIHPLTGILLVDQVAVVILRAEIDDSTAALLNLSPRNLDSTLILHTIFGKDHFISVSGEFQYTCFANKLERLIRFPGPARSLTSPNQLLPESRSRSTPKELLRLINWMMSNPASTNEIFISKGNESTIASIRECLDTGDEFSFPPETSDVATRLAFADTLLRFLISLPEAVVPPSLHSRCIGATDRDEAFEILENLPPVSINVWISFTSLIHYACGSLKEEQRKRIALVVAPVLLRDDPDLSSLPISPIEKAKFLSFFIFQM